MTNNGEIGDNEVGTARRLVVGGLARRRMLAATMSIAFASLSVLFVGRVERGRSRRVVATDVLAQLLSDRTSVVRVGTAYLATAPGDADPAAAFDRMRRHGGALASALEDGSLGQVRRIAARGIREDFARGRIIKVDGWLLSQTEARLCALALMLCGAPQWRRLAEDL